MNKNINISNYEEFLIDFLDGTLDETTHAQVLLFLENNPDIAEEFNGIGDVVVEDCIGKIDFKDELRIKLEPKLLLNTENYEHYFIAYHQGDLSNDEIIQIDDFLIENPQLQKDFELYKTVSSLSPKEVVFDDKDSLKVVEFASNVFIRKSEFETICIDYFEGNLDTETTNTLLDAIDNNKELEGIFNLYHNTKFKADNSIVFEEKSKLYRRRMIAVVPAIQYINSIAAAILILLMFNVYNFNLDSLSIDNNILGAKRLRVPAGKKIYTSDRSLELNSSSKVNSVEPITDDNVTESTEIKPKSTKKQMSVAKYEIEHMKPKDMQDCIVSDDIKMGHPKLIKYEASAKDTSYIEIKATKLVSNNSSASETSPTEIQGQRVPDKFKRKITRIFKREKEYYANIEPKQAFNKISKFAVKSYNRMTEREEPVAKK